MNNPDGADGSVVTSDADERKNRAYRILGKSFFALLIVTFVVLLCIYVIDLNKDTEYMSPAQMMELVNSEEDIDKPYAASYFYEWNFLPVEESKLQSIETVFRDYYVKAAFIPSGYEMAKKTVSLFIDNFYYRIDTKDEALVTDAIISCYVEAVGDPYAVYRTPEEYGDYSGDMSGTFIGIGVSIEYDSEAGVITITEITEDSGAEAAGLLAGDCIIGVDGHTLAQIGYEALVDKIKGQADTVVKITVLRDGETLDIDVLRKQITERTVKYSILDGGIGYIRITAFKRNTAEQFRAAVDALEAARVRAVIYDVRGNLGGYVDSVADVLSYIVPRGTAITSYSNKYANPIKADSDHTFLIPSVVLCNGRTASGGELFASAMRDYNTMGLLDATLVGVTTYGKGVMQDSLTYTDGSVLTLTVAYYYPPLGEAYGYDGEGITPDIELVPSSEGDNQLDKALEVINEMLK